MSGEEEINWYKYTQTTHLYKTRLCENRSLMPDTHKTKTAISLLHPSTISLRHPLMQCGKIKILRFIRYHKFSRGKKILYGSNKLSQRQCVVCGENQASSCRLYAWALREMYKSHIVQHSYWMSTGHTSRGKLAFQEILTAHDDFYYVWSFMRNIT